MSIDSLLILVRHGQTEANLEKVWHGSTDTPLTDFGHRQAARAAAFVSGEHPTVTRVYSSPLQRARHTARPIAEAYSVEVEIEPGLAEFHLGAWEGKSYRELAKRHLLWEHFKKDPDFRPHGGESPRQVVDRVAGALQAIHDRHAGERVVVVTHGGVLAMALSHLLDGDYREWRRVMDNCAVSELSLRPPPTLHRFNHTAHLQSEAVDEGDPR